LRFVDVFHDNTEELCNETKLETVESNQRT